MANPVNGRPPGNVTLAAFFHFAHVELKRIMSRKVTFKPNDVSIHVDKGTNLLEAALAADVHVNASCGGQGVCGKCRVIIESGGVDSKKTENISQEDFEQGVRQACGTLVVSDCTVEIPVESRGPQALVVTERDMGLAERMVSDLETEPLGEGWAMDPLAVKVPVRLTPPTLEDNVSDLARLRDGLKGQHGIEDLSIEVRCLKEMPGVLRENDWQVTATLMDTQTFSEKETNRPLKLVRLEGRDTSEGHLALALDIGTTTVCSQLIDIGSGKVVAEKAQYNGQIKHGDDVITRIVFAQKREGAKTLQSLVVSSINEVIDGLVEETGVSKRSISCVCAAGNTTMTHLLLGMETRYIRESPYVPVASFMLQEGVEELGIDLPDSIQILTFPSVASYVGGDIVSGILGSGISQREETTLYIDIGTNGEVVLGNRDWLACAACSMGPAFEGGGVRHGMRADVGAIEGFHINPVTLEPMVVTVGRASPRGICGSGLISVLSELFSGCVIDRKGKFVQGLSSDRIREGRFGYEYVLAWAKDSATGQDIVITEVDVENLIRAKGALFAGCLTLLDSLSLSFDDIDKVVIAGAFGRYINLEKGKLIGLFPDLPVEKFHFLGNGSLMGARMACLSKGVLREAERIRSMMTNVELSDNQSFMDKYMGALFLPHTEDRLFPPQKIRSLF